MALPPNTLSSLHTLQDDEDHKPRLSKISWLPDVLVFHSSIIPTVLGPVLSVSLFAGSVAVAALMWGKQGIWVSVTVPSPPTDGSQPSITRARLTEEKKKLIRLVVAFVIATKHHLRAEGGVHHDDLKGALASSIPLGKPRRGGLGDGLIPFAGLLPDHLAGASLRQLRAAGQEPSHIADDHLTSTRGLNMPLPPSPSVKSLLINDEEASLGLSTSTSPALRHSPSVSSVTRLSQSQSPLLQSPASELPHLSFARSAIDRIKNPTGALSRRPTAVRIVMPTGYADHAQDHAHMLPPHLVSVRDNGKKRIDERTPLIKPGVKPDVRRTPEDVRAAKETIKRTEIGLGRMIELGLPLVIAHEISRTIFMWSRMGCLEAIGPAGMNAMQGLVQSMTDQLGAMERMQTPLPVIFGVHLKQTVTLFLCILPFTLVDLMGWKMVVIVTCCAFTMMGVEHIAAQVEMPFGTDPGDLNLDLFCTELLCECEAILERLPEGDEDEHDIFLRSVEQVDIDEWADDGADGE
ncbi:hypothetical protein JCM24511_02597 [Saitozyma sp. JCM 24511]|nr:hypothetical protein JCM24511_02597 [Saitozyma sp. JCM 24511]